ncbi:DNA adenine methylase [Campylobacter sp. MIT 21-1685]|uniref:DNA adenine methylase n=1 Tax=unclassified Campylobacter TaxID=2593542 RepID=UPI00224B049A|nr:MULTISPECIES: DNA adenine methylase [unclassified Campylobacter]MCX2683376.1 DNA adenine methylase [Campylobacter sp. MIT 21-1684]MCX2751697.1 DNA adenine methylase [Campylobacter sp. MIT 21-1682]MCX2807899.1 DNA adenine methylase [Campylobacter sp. MIT 21-1685]
MTKALDSYASKPIKSPLNYIGGKYRILSQILPLFPSKSDIFVDLFCGGCSVGININQAQKIICNDNLKFLIDLYEFLQKSSAEFVVKEIHHIIAQYHLNLQNTQGYNNLRNAYNAHKSPLLLFALIAFSFNHQIRFNNAHQFNNPFGKNRSHFNPTMQENLCNFIYTLRHKPIQFLSLDFREALNSLSLTQQSFVYADPPYLITQGTYNDGKRGFSGWNEELEKSLLESLNQLHSQGIQFALSNVLIHKNKENHILRQWLESNNYKVHFINTHYTNANYQAKYKDKIGTKEVLITNYNPLQIFQKGRKPDAFYRQ